MLDAAVEVLAERGYERSRFADVAAATEVAISTLQSYFGSREDMLIEALFRASDRRGSEGGSRGANRTVGTAGRLGGAEPDHADGETVDVLTGSKTPPLPGPAGERKPSHLTRGAFRD
jgi:AcrR family transcriptional regulator